MNTNAADVNTLTPMTEQIVTNTGTAPAQVLADAGYSSTANLECAASFTTTDATEFFIAPRPPPPRRPAAGRPTRTHPSHIGINGLAALPAS